MRNRVGPFHLLNLQLIEEKLRIAPCQPDELRHLTLGRHEEVDLLPFLPAQPFREGLFVIDRRGNHNLLRHETGVEIVLLDHDTEDLPLCPPFDIAEIIMLSSDDLSFPQLENNAARIVPLRHARNDVAFDGIEVHHLLLLAVCFKPLDPVAEKRGFFIPLRAGELRHLLPQ